jgi:hypothetical protein
MRDLRDNKLFLQILCPIINTYTQLNSPWKIAQGNYWNFFLLFFGTAGLLSFGYEILLIPFGIGWMIMGYHLIFTSKKEFN